uniref:Helicase C-terminal domain-containing protein n=1 Tax=Glossina palpalis gambiensis TaxID=67801 RepID=A0A1B0C1L3_9MUSC
MIRELEPETISKVYSIAISAVRREPVPTAISPGSTTGRSTPNEMVITPTSSNETPTSMPRSLLDKFLKDCERITNKDCEWIANENYAGPSTSAQAARRQQSNPHSKLVQIRGVHQPRGSQGGSSGGLRAFTQQQQIQIMNNFRSGKSNILIATSIGKGGIDVGEVDLITCFRLSSANPTRFIQRIGRIGRQSNDQLNKKLLRSQIVKQSLYQQSQRLLPRQLTPTCIRSFIKPIEKELKEVKVKKTKTTPKAKGKVNQDLRKYFNSKKCEKDKAVEFFQLDPTPKETNPGSYTQQCMQKKFERIEDLLKDFEGTLTTNACEENQLLNVPLNKEMVERQVKNIGIDPKHTSKINKFLETRQNSRGVLLRAETTDLAQHLKPSEMSNEMKIALLELNPKIYRAKLGKYDSFERSRL